MATIIYADGSTKMLMPKNGRAFSLDELKKVVGGYIEVTDTIIGDWVMVVNEEGKLLGLPFNYIATRMHKYNDVIVGNVLLCLRSEIQ